MDGQPGQTPDQTPPDGATPPDPATPTAVPEPEPDSAAHAAQDDGAREAAARRKAQDAAADLVRMGIDPTDLGLEPSTEDPEVAADEPTRVTGRAAVPPTTAVPGQYVGSRRRSWVHAFGTSTTPHRTSGTREATGPHVGTAAPASPPATVAAPAAAPPADAPASSPPADAPASPTVTPGVPLWPSTVMTAPTPVPPAAPAPPPEHHEPPTTAAVPAPSQPTTPPTPQPMAPPPPNAVTPEGWPLQGITSPEPERFGIVVPTAWRRLVRAVTFGILDPGAAAAMAAERKLVRLVRSRQREPKVVAFIAGKGGVGTSTTAAAMALTLAAVRNDPTVLVDAQTGAASLGRRIAGRPAPTTLEVTGDATDTSAAQPLSLSSGLHLVDSAPWHSPVPRAELARLLGQLPVRFPFTLVDIGNETADAARGALALASRVVLVTTQTVDTVESVRIALSRIVQANPDAFASVVVALVCRSRHSYRPYVRQLTRELGLTHVVPIPYDRALTLGRPVAPNRMRAATREAYLTLAAHVAAPPVNTTSQQTISLAGLLDGPRPRE